VPQLRFRVRPDETSSVVKRLRQLPVETPAARVSIDESHSPHGGTRPMRGKCARIRSADRKIPRDPVHHTTPRAITLRDRKMKALVQVTSFREFGMKGDWLTLLLWRDPL